MKRALAAALASGILAIFLRPRATVEPPASFEEAGALVRVLAPGSRPRVAASAAAIAVEAAPPPERPLHGAPPWERRRFALDREREVIANAPLGEECQR
jgi:hypothetical protein